MPRMNKRCFASLLQLTQARKALVYPTRHVIRITVSLTTCLDRVFIGYGIQPEQPISAHTKAVYPESTFWWLRLEDVLQVPGLEPATTDSAGGFLRPGWAPAVCRGGRCPIGDRMRCGRLTGAVQFNSGTRLITRPRYPIGQGSPGTNLAN